MQLLALRSVLVAIDLDGSSNAAWTSARDLASAAGSELHVIHVATANAKAVSIEGDLERVGVSRGNAEVHLLSGDPAHTIRLTADKLGVDVIVLGPHRVGGRGPGLSSLGSTALAVVTNASVPCLVTATPMVLPLKQVIAAVDLTDTARGTLLVALSWASALRAREATPTLLTAVHVVDARSSVRDEERGRAIDNELEPIRAAAGGWAGVRLERQIIRAESTAAGIASHANGHSANLIALGTRGLGVEPIGRLGSVSAELMNRIDLPILLVPPAMWREHQDALAS